MNARAASATRTGHLAVRGIRMYHEIHGEGGGVPLVLLHGGGSTIDVTPRSATTTCAG